MQKLIAVVGTNASGKSGLGIELARHYGGEVISADSRQVYRGLDLGSGKVTAAEMGVCPIICWMYARRARFSPWRIFSVWPMQPSTIF